MVYLPRCWQWLVAAWALAFCAGCGRLLDSRGGSSPLTPLVTAPETVHLDVVFLNYPEGDAEINRDLWQRIDEQQIPVALRSRLQANGLRIGVIDSQLPEGLEKRLQLTDKPLQTETQLVADQLESDSPVRQRSLQIRAGRRANVICTGEHQKHAEMSILVRGENGEVTGKTYRKVSGMFAARAYPEGDGRVRLDLTPEIEHGDPQRRFDQSEGMLRVDFGPAHERFEPLRMEVVLSPGQMVVVGAAPGRPGSLGYRLFSEAVQDRKLQKLLIVRVARTGYEDSFQGDTALDFSE